MSANRSGKVLKDESPAVKDKLPETKVESQYVPKMGDIVIFNYRNPSAKSSIAMPLVITKVHQDYKTIDGVALNTNNTGGAMGAISVHGLLPGKGDFEWRTA